MELHKAQEILSNIYVKKPAMGGFWNPYNSERGLWKELLGKNREWKTIDMFGGRICWHDSSPESAKIIYKLKTRKPLASVKWLGDKTVVSIYYIGWTAYIVVDKRGWWKGSPVWREAFIFYEQK